MISDYGLSDIFRLTRGNDKVFTHLNKQHEPSSRLDFFLIDDNLVNFPICTSDISHGYNSDHSYVSPNIQGTSIFEGKLGYWKFNNLHLLNDDSKHDIDCIVTESRSFDSYRGLWDTIKFKFFFKQKINKFRKI